MLLACVSAKGQSHSCDLMKDTVYYVTIRIDAANIYPIMISGLSKSLSTKNLQKENIDSLINSFYRNHSYVPQLFAEYNGSIFYCLGHDKGMDYLRQHQMAESEINYKLYNTRSNSNSSSILYISDRYVVNMYVSRVYGSFWIADKARLGQGSSSETFNIQKIPAIQKCYVPFELIWYHKP
jgi:hypothetical protein